MPENFEGNDTFCVTFPTTRPAALHKTAETLVEVTRRKDLGTMSGSYATRNLSMYRTKVNIRAAHERLLAVKKTQTGY